MATIKSVTMLSAVDEYVSAVATMSGTHVPGIRLSQYRARGWHWLTTYMRPEKALPTERRMRILSIRRCHRSCVIRSNIKQILALTMDSVHAYVACHRMMTCNERSQHLRVSYREAAYLCALVELRLIHVNILGADTRESSIDGDCRLAEVEYLSRCMWLVVACSNMR